MDKIDEADNVYMKALNLKSDDIGNNLNLCSKVIRNNSKLCLFFMCI